MSELYFDGYIVYILLIINSFIYVLLIKIEFCCLLLMYTLFNFFMYLLKYYDQLHHVLGFSCSTLIIDGKFTSKIFYKLYIHASLRCVTYFYTLLIIYYFIYALLIKIVCCLLLMYILLIKIVCVAYQLNIMTWIIVGLYCVYTTY